MRLSKPQEQVLVLLCEGDIIFDEQDSSIGLEDADHNSYIIRKDTFNILVNNGYITFASRPTISQRRYILTHKAKKYLKQYCLEEIKDFL